jgi:hypothetical protein
MYNDILQIFLLNGYKITMSILPLLFLLIFFYYRNHHMNRGLAFAQMDGLDDSTFIRMSRVDQQTFNKNLHLIKSVIVKWDAVKVINRSVSQPNQC